MELPKEYDQARIALLKGGLGVIPTDTVYGLVAMAENKSAVSRLYELKNRQHKPGTVIAANIEQLVNLGITRRYLKAVENLWPDPISVVIPVGNELRYIHLNKGGIALRIVSNEPLVQLLKQTGPLLTSSANSLGQKVATDIGQAKSFFNDKVDFYVDGGDLSGQVSSTIIRIIDDEIEVLRQGVIRISDINTNPR